MKREYVPGSRQDFAVRRSPSAPPLRSSLPPLAPTPVARPAPLPAKPPSSRTEFTVRLTTGMADRVNAALAGVPDNARDGAIISLLEDGLVRRASMGADKEKEKGAANLRFGLAFCNRLLRLIQTEGAEKGVEYLKQRIAEMEAPVKETDSSEARWVQFIRLAELLATDDHVPAERRAMASGLAAQVKAVPATKPGAGG